MKNLILLLILLLIVPFISNAQEAMDEHRWFLNPDGERVKISIDDLHDEILTASPKLKWGREVIPSLELKKDIVIAVIDGGIEIEHPELKNHVAYNSAECFEGNIIPPKDGEDKDNNGYKGDCAGWDFTENHNRPEDQDGHGTHVTGVVRAVMNGIQGNFKFLPLKVFAPNENMEQNNGLSPLPIRLAKAFEYAISRNVDIIHLSVGWPRNFMTHELETKIKEAISKGIIIVSAAGNSSQRATIYPCQMEGVICVGALRPDGTPARFSNWGSQVDIFAPGEKILSTIPHTIAPLHISRKGYDFKNGTSQAAPFITAVMAVLKGTLPEQPSPHLYARLMKAAAQVEDGKGLKGMFHLDRALKLAPSSFIYPDLKGVHSVVVDNGEFSLKLALKNYWLPKSSQTKVALKCDEALIENGETAISPMDSFEKAQLTFKGKFSSEENFINCTLAFDQRELSLRLKVQHKLTGDIKRKLVKQDELLVINTRTGARSRFMTVNSVKGTVPAPIYYVLGDKKIDLYKEDKLLGTPTLPTGCSFLRLWQIDLDQNGDNELMVEGLCDKTHLLYQFIDLNLNEVFPAVKYKPALTILNYDDFEVVLNGNLPPSFRFMNMGFTIPTETPWDSDVTGKANHFYELFPVKSWEGYNYDVKVMEAPEEWKKSLKLRYLPAYEVLHQIKGKLLVKIGQKTAWVDVDTQKAEWANLDHVLLRGSRKQDLIGTEEFVLQSFLTPYEYRGFLLNGLRLRFIQEDRFDPLFDILGTEQNERGYKTIVRSFQRLIYLQYDFMGNLIEKKATVVDRFDFLTAQDLIASVVNLVHEGKMIQLVDGTKVNTNYVDLIIAGNTRSLDIPTHCVTQNPVVIDGSPVLPVFCAKNRTEFEMRFIGLN